MPAQKLSQSDLFGSLLVKQHKHEKLLARVEKTSARLARHKSRFLALEADIDGIGAACPRPARDVSDATPPATASSNPPVSSSTRTRGVTTKTTPHVSPG